MSWRGRPEPAAEGGGALLSVQYLRGFAALAVVVYHAMRWTDPAFEIGAAGVDVFFVISGFILWTVAWERPVTAGTFLQRRWARVAPLYWLLTLLVAGLVLVWPNSIWDAHLDLRQLILSLAFIPHRNAAGEPFPLITAGWSLNYEAMFYLLFAISLIAPQRHRLKALTGLVLMIPVIGLTVRGMWFIGFNIMVLQFLAGAVFANWRQKRRPKNRTAGIIMVVAGVALFGIMAPMNLFEAIYRAIWWGIPAFLIVAGAVLIEDDGGLKDIPALRLLGDASYSIYLTHVIVVQLLSHPLNPAHLSFIPVAIVLSLVCGVAAYYLLERPLNRLFRPRRAPALPSQTA